MTAREDYVLGPQVADWDRLLQPLSVDPVIFEIIRHKLEAINEEQGLALKVRRGMVNLLGLSRENLLRQVMEVVLALRPGH